jgi:hypothetical protein
MILERGAIRARRTFKDHKKATAFPKAYRPPLMLCLGELLGEGMAVMI